jgi:2-amino-4-hydroxy-6-hydroxymethyldihydropteridine diphosphokinase
VVPTFIGLGSNLSDPEWQLHQALQALRALPNSRFLACSSFYRSKPLGPQDQPDFINAVAALETDLPAQMLLDQLQQIEQQQGRVRKRHWGERTLDLDILLYGRQKREDSRLSLPHPQMGQRSFVMLPLLELMQSLTAK